MSARRRGRLWWFLRFGRAYHRHGVLGYNGLRKTWADAMFARRMMAPAEQRALGPLRRRP